MSYRIGSFNLCKFNFESTEKSKKDFDTIAEIIRNEQFDIIALQEVLSPNALQYMVRLLGQNWKYKWASPSKSVSAQAAEGYAFVWNENTVSLVETETITERDGISTTQIRTFEPHIYNQYRIDRKAGQRELIRNPYYGRFKPKNSFCELRVINTHIRFGKDSDSDIGAAKMRNHEFDILAENLYDTISKRRYGNNMDSYTILLGDYNLNLKRPWTHGPYLNSEEKTITDANNATCIYHIITVQDQLTTLKNSDDSSNAGNTNRGYANNYDHFSYSKEAFQNINVSVQRIDSVRKYEGDDFSKHRKEISDHIPISLDLNLNSR